MYSKNNIDRPKAEREYFDRPIQYQHQGFVFSPEHIRPIEFSGVGSRRTSVLVSRNGGSRGGNNSVPYKERTQSQNFSTRSSFFNAMASTGFSKKAANQVIPVTNGLNNV
jgi:hypothetical protein